MPVAGRRKNFDLHSSEVKGFLLVARDHTDSKASGVVKQRGDRGCLWQGSDPQLMGPKIVQDCAQAANVIGMGVSDGDGVKPRDTALP